MTGIKKSNNWIRIHFSFFFLFRSCRKGKKKKDSLVQDFEEDSLELEKNNQSTPIVKDDSKIISSEFITPPKVQKHPSANKWNKEYPLKQLSTSAIFKEQMNSKSKHRDKENNRPKVVKNLNLKFSPLKRRNDSFSPSKTSPLNCHVTVELADTPPYSNPKTHVDSNDNNDHKALLQEEVTERSKTRKSVTFKNENPTRVVGRSKSFSEKVTVPPKRHSSGKLPLLFNAKLSTNSHNKFRWRSAGNLNIGSNELNDSPKKSTAEQKPDLNQSPESAEAKNNLNTSPKQMEFCGSKLTAPQKSFKAYTNPREKTNQIQDSQVKIRNRTPNQPKLIHSSESNARSTHRCPRPQSMITGSSDSNYVMLNPLPSVFKNSVKHQNSSFYGENLTNVTVNQQKQPNTAALMSAKSHDYLGPHNSYDSSSKWKTSPYHSNTNGPQLYTSPAVDYAAKVEDLLVKLRRSLQHDHDRNIYTDDVKQNSFDLPSQMFPMKKSKSLEPISAHAQMTYQNEFANQHRLNQASRSRNRVRHIAKKYNMYTSNEDFFSPQSTSQWSYPESSPGLGYNDYVYLSQIPKTSSPNRPMTSSNQENYASQFGYSSGFHDSAISYSQDPYLMASRSGDFYHLNLYVKNPRPTPDGAESSSCSFGSEMSSGKLGSNRDSSNRPQVFYALDV